MSHPFFGDEFEFTQPDGTTLRVRGWGDQQRAVFQTLDGRAVKRDLATGFFAEPVPGAAPAAATTDMSRLLGTDAASQDGLPVSGTRWQQRRLERRLPAGDNPLLAPPQRQTVGTFVGLCLLVEFPDVPATIPRAEVEAFCNTPGYTGFGNNGSVLDYFRDVSGGRVKYTNLVAPYYRATHNRSYYTNEAIRQPTRAIELIGEALNDLLLQGPDLSALSTDSRGFVYAVNVFYAGPVVNTWSRGLWPHAHHLGVPHNLGLGMDAHDYQITNMGSELTLGTFCHENGHMLCDFPDLYDYNGKSNGVGGYCLMCAGGNISKKNPVQVGAYLKNRAGWSAKVDAISAGATVELRSDQNDFAIASNSPTEYFIFENRQQAGRDQALPDAGLAIWHVDERGDNSNSANTLASHYECSLVQADGRSDLEGRVNLGDATDLFRDGHNAAFGPSTRPPSHWWDGTATPLELFNISPLNPKMKFSVVESRRRGG